MNRFLPMRRLVQSRFAAVLLVCGLLLTGCEARGGGSIDDPLPGVPPGTYQGRATFGFSFSCEVRNGKALVRGQIEYHDDAPSTVSTVSFTGVALHGVAEPTVIPQASTCPQALEIVGSRGASFTGIYRPQNPNPAIPDTVEQGKFVVQVFDQGEPGRSKGDFTGDGFVIELVGGTYTGYTRGGYIEGGNIQVR